MAGTQPDGGRKPEASKTAGAWIIGISTVVMVACIGLSVAGGGDDGGTDVPAPTAVERGDTVPILERSSASQGICYGWVLEDFYAYDDEPLSVGSNLGDGVAVEGNPACPRWLQVHARVGYIPESSESNDSASVAVSGSSDISVGDLTRMANGLERFGLTDEVFIDDPGWATTRAAVMLPLLAAEVELVEPAAAPAADPTASRAPLPDAGTDLWRDRWGYLIATGALLLVTALFVTVGLVQRRRQLARAAAAASGRTREEA
ncbi:hypothetical protein ABGB16_02480 [Micromonospora sp. B11E3]|uniref:hypothetical protein n=1 Tax=Micromonospora sp. B11E3 TaxID=3153562 RepID=UPI00325CED42